MNKGMYKLKKEMQFKRDDCYTNQVKTFDKNKSFLDWISMITTRIM